MTTLNKLFEDMLADSDPEEAQALVEKLDLHAYLVSGRQDDAKVLHWFVGEGAGSRAEVAADRLAAESARGASIFVVNREEGCHKTAIVFAPHSE